MWHFVAWMAVQMSLAVLGSIFVRYSRVMRNHYSRFILDSDRYSTIQDSLLDIHERVIDTEQNILTA